jgi:predicted negative regulator of RcsB-dependent stress response
LPNLNFDGNAVVEELLTDQQQAEHVKSWVRQNGIFLVTVLTLGLGGQFGWSQWRHYQERQAEEASELYETFLQSARANQLEQAEAGMARLATDYGSSPYADHGRLAMARLYLDQGKPEPAAEALQTVVGTGVTPEIRNIARLRLARLLIYQEKYDEALKTVGDSGSRAFSPAFHDVRGDVYYAMGKLPEARSEYEQALNGDNSAKVIEGTYVQAKLDDIGGATADLATLPAAPSPAP